jgi:hypothetical protein
MKKIFIILLAVFFLLFGMNAAIADQWNGHGNNDGGGSSHGGNSYHGNNGGGGSGHSGNSYHGNSGGHGGYSGNYHGGNNYSHHGGHGYSHYNHSNHGHHDYWYDYGWETAAIGLGAAVVGSAIVNSYYREPVTVVEHQTYYEPAPLPPPCRVWVPGHYIYGPYGHYTYVPGYYE